MSGMGWYLKGASSPSQRMVDGKRGRDFCKGRPGRREGVELLSQETSLTFSLPSEKPRKRT